jgi:hypothetical protein
MPTLTEHHYNTAEQIEGYLRMALDVVEKVSPPDDLRQLAYGKAVDLFAAKTVVMPQVAQVPDLGGLRH